jgi:hypothetical protein
MRHPAAFECGWKPHLQQGGAIMAKTPAPGPTIPIVGPLLGLVFGGPLRRALPLIAVSAAVGGVGYWAWTEQAPRIAVEQHYLVGLDAISITPPPEWITTDVKTEALRDGSIDLPVSVLDPQLVERLAKAFSFHPWVAEVKQVRKSTGAVDVELVYRRPVCMVELPPTDTGRGLYAVDADGTLLPSRDFLGETKKAARYPRLGGFTPAEVARVGARWPDTRVVGGAKIAALLVDCWSRLNLAKITPAEEATNPTALPTFELVTAGGSRVLWGHPPGAENDAEMNGGKKVEALLRYVAEHGTLEGRDGPQRLDARGAQMVVVAAGDKPAAKRK